jgi:DNA topoisomerase-2
MTIEPKFYVPILPLILINGCEGIGTGWSTTVLPHKVKDVIEMMKERIKRNYKHINIGWEGYEGEVIFDKKGSYIVKGRYEIDGDTVNIT